MRRNTGNPDENAGVNEGLIKLTILELKGPTIDGIPVDEYIEQNADQIWLHQNGMYETLHAREKEEDDIHF